MKRPGWLLGVVLLASCSSSDGAATTSGEVAATPASPSAAVVAIAADPCTLLTSEEVATATELPVAEVVPNGTVTCVYDLGAEAGVEIFVTVDDGASRITSPSAVYADYAARLGDGEAEAVTNVGAGAVYDSGFRAIAIDAGGGRFFVVGVNGGYQHLDEPREALISLGQAALERL